MTSERIDALKLLDKLEDLTDNADSEPGMDFDLIYAAIAALRAELGRPATYEVSGITFCASCGQRERDKDDV